ncbi:MULTISPECIES: hypothetical protein [Bradyrhizobium]|uniref:hypothetical protein n=1 Tax=Bradyrhizobium TaxID=374 RepID=UPI0004B18A2A|nr:MULTISPECIES: hypothetical protein [Bradyrhizobium]MCA1544960.1 hypothetical protein [Bradyrhizobium sp. NBAIM32]
MANTFFAPNQNLHVTFAFLALQTVRQLQTSPDMRLTFVNTSNLGPDAELTTRVRRRM